MSNPNRLDSLLRISDRERLLNSSFLSENEKIKLQSILDELEQLITLFPEKAFSNYVLINWAEVLAGKNFNFDKFLSQKNAILKKLAKNADSAMTWVYLAFVVIGLALTIAAMLSLNVGVLSGTVASAASTTSWNDIDALGGIVMGIRQLAHGEKTMGITNLMSGFQLLGCTTTANIAQFTSLLPQLATAATLTAFTGFSFAACMGIACAIELYEVRQCDKRIQILEQKLNHPSGNITTSQITSLKKAILIEKALRKNHERSARAWAGCTLAMTAIAVISYIALSGITFGSLPLLTVIIAVAAVLSGLIRNYWVGLEDYVEKAKMALEPRPIPIELPQPSEPAAEVPQQPGFLLESIFNKLQKILITAQNPDAMLNFSKEISIEKGYSLFTAKIKFSAFLEELAVANPSKLQLILEAIEELTKKNNPEKLKNYIGEKMYNELSPSSSEASNPPSTAIAKNMQQGNS